MSLCLIRFPPEMAVDYILLIFAVYQEWISIDLTSSIDYDR